jgi:hypothetical protein
LLVTVGSGPDGVGTGVCEPVGTVADGDGVGSGVGMAVGDAVAFATAVPDGLGLEEGATEPRTVMATKTATSASTTTAPIGATLLSRAAIDEDSMALSMNRRTASAHRV